MNRNIIVYPSFTLCSIVAESAEMVPNATPDMLYRVELPYHNGNINVMRKKGYLFSDRTIGVMINLRRNNIDYQKMLRFDIRRAKDERDDILRISRNSFTQDSRFHVRPANDDDQAYEIIADYVENLSEAYVCLYKEQVVGFLDLEQYEENSCFIHLAAVQEKYRVAGVAVSLYAKAVLIAKERGCEKVYGRISSGNVAVMNLYAYLGATFFDPKDVFVRDE